MSKKKTKGSLSKFFNESGAISMENAKSPFFISGMIFFALCTAPFSLPMAKTLLMMPTISFGSGFVLKKIGQGMQSIKNKFKPS